MQKKIKQGILVGAMVGCFHVLPAFAVCPPGTVPSNPAPKAQAESLAQFFANFTRHEEETQTVTLKKGQHYWFAANGCPRMGQIGISMLDSKGKVMKKAQASSPSFCFTAPRDGEYIVKVKAISLRGSNTFGGIDAQLSESGCRN